MNILGKPSATQEQCQEWINNVPNAHPLAKALIPSLWDSAIKNGIDPVVLIAQAMKETGYFNFKGVLRPNFCNTCGLKITKGGGDYEIGAHMRFKSWEDGIMAQSDHLALYAGGPTVPKYSPECGTHQNKDCKANGTTKDPRHFTYLFGKCPTVESLGCNWAPSASYGTDIVRMVNEVYAIEVPPHIEEPKPEPNEPIKPVEPIIKPQVSLKEPVKQPIKKPVQQKPIVDKNKLQEGLRKGLANFKRNIKNMKKKK